MAAGGHIQARLGVIKVTVIAVHGNIE